MGKIDSTRCMTLGEMRAEGIRCVSLDCGCGHTAEANVDAYPDSIGVPDVRLRFRCSKCKARPYRSMPCWHHQVDVPGTPNTRRR